MKLNITQSALKIIAMLTMLIDHIGLLIFPEVAIFRIIGRLAMPLFAYCIGEGCLYSKHKKQYLCKILGCAVVFQIVYYLIHQSFVLCVLWSYAAFVAYVILLEWAKHKATIWLIVPNLFMIASVLGLLISQSDYLCFAFLLILPVYFIKNRYLQLFIFAIILFVLGFIFLWQMWALMVLPLLFFYKGDRGKLRFGNFMYVYYPLHYLVLGIIQYIVAYV